RGEVPVGRRRRPRGRGQSIPAATSSRAEGLRTGRNCPLPPAFGRRLPTPPFPRPLAGGYRHFLPPAFGRRLPTPPYPRPSAGGTFPFAAGGLLVRTSPPYPRPSAGGTFPLRSAQGDKGCLTNGRGIPNIRECPTMYPTTSSRTCSVSSGRSRWRRSSTRPAT